MNSFILLALFAALIAVTTACGFGSLGGSSCGCAPPPMPCGCGGRKKRSTEETGFTELSSESGDVLCNSPQLKKIITENLKPTARESKVAISTIVEQAGERYVVVCSQVPFSYAVRHDTTICAGGNADHICHVFEL